MREKAELRVAYESNLHLLLDKRDNLRIDEQSQLRREEELIVHQGTVEHQIAHAQAMALAEGAEVLTTFDTVLQSWHGGIPQHSPNSSDGAPSLDAHLAITDNDGQGNGCPSPATVVQRTNPHSPSSSSETVTLPAGALVAHEATTPPSAQANASNAPTQT